VKNPLSVDIDAVETLPARTMLTLLELKQRQERAIARAATCVKELAHVFLELERADVEVRFDLSIGCVDVPVTGTAEKFQKVWGILRRAGWKPSNHPKKGDVAYSDFWWREDAAEYPSIYFNFSSTQCTRVKVGTKMVEQDVFEVRCADALPDMAPQAQEVVAA
jgi:hypothetical protein